MVYFEHFYEYDLESEFLDEKDGTSKATENKDRFRNTMGFQSPTKLSPHKPLLKQGNILSYIL